METVSELGRPPARNRAGHFAYRLPQTFRLYFGKRRHARFFAQRTVRAGATGIGTPWRSQKNDRNRRQQRNDVVRHPVAAPRRPVLPRADAAGAAAVYPAPPRQHGKRLHAAHQPELAGTAPAYRRRARLRKHAMAEN